MLSVITFFICILLCYMYMKWDETNRDNRGKMDALCKRFPMPKLTDKTVQYTKLQEALISSMLHNIKPQSEESFLGQIIHLPF